MNTIVGFTIALCIVGIFVVAPVFGVAWATGWGFWRALVALGCLSLYLAPRDMWHMSQTAEPVTVNVAA